MICSVLLKSFELRQQAICLRCINSFSVHSRSFKTRAAAAWIQCKSRSEDKLRPENKIRIKNSERRAEKMLLGVCVCSQDYTLLYLKDSFSPEGVDKQLHSRRITTVSVCVCVLVVSTFVSLCASAGLYCSWRLQGIKLSIPLSLLLLCLTFPKFPAQLLICFPGSCAHVPVQNICHVRYYRE